MKREEPPKQSYKKCVKIAKTLRRKLKSAKREIKEKDILIAQLKSQIKDLKTIIV